MEKKPIVLIIDNSIDMTGALKSIARVSVDLKEFYEFHFLIPTHSKSKSFLESRGFSTIYELPLREIGKRISSLIVYFPFLLYNAIRLRAIVKKNGIGALHVNDLYNLLPVVIRLVGVRLPYVCHIRFLPNRFPKWLFTFWLRLHLVFAEKIILVSKSVEKMLAAHSKIVVIHNELPLEERYTDTFFATDNKPYKTFLYLANFMDGKGQLFALKAFARIHEILPEWRLRFVGSDMGLKKNMEYVRLLKQKAHELNIEKKVALAGFTNDVEREYKQADIVLNFSESESFSMVCAEALYFGRALIATDCGGPSEIVDNQVTGVLVPNKNVDAMAKAMFELAKENKKREMLGSAARQSVREKFSMEKTSFRLKEIYDQVIKRER